MIPNQLMNYNIFVGDLDLVNTFQDEKRNNSTPVEVTVLWLS